jgi:predicted membrane protein
MAIKMHFNYKEYPNSSEATDISYLRGLFKVYHRLACSCLFLFSIASLFAFDFLGICFGILGIAITVIWFLYLIFRYDKVTEKQIEQHFKDKEEIKKSKYICKYIKVFDETKNGTCRTCNTTNTSLTLCEIKNDVGKRKVYICEECIKKYHS